MKVFVLVIGLLLAATPAGTALAQQSAGPGQEQQGGGQVNQGVLAKADSLKGLEVIDSNGRSLGKIDSATLDLVSGKISYIAVDPGKGDKLVPVPYDMFGVMRDKRLVLNVDKNRLDAAPSYAKSSQPNWANPQWAQQVSGFWGKGPSGIATSQASPAATGSSTQPTTMQGNSQSPPSGQQPMGSGGQQPAGSSQPPTGNQPT